MLKYDLPSAYELFDATPGKMDWKTRVSDAINFYWDQETRKEASIKTSLKYLNIDALEIGTVHPVWRTLSANTREVEMAAVKARLLTGTYVLQANRAITSFKPTPLVKYVVMNQRIDTISSLDAGVLWAVEMSI